MSTERSDRRSTAAGVLLLVCAMLVGLTGCFGTKEGRPTVVVTTNILGDVTRKVVGDEADVKVLMKPNADPHSFGVSAAEAAQIESADLVVYNGLGLEENVLRHVEAAKESDVPTLGVADAVEPLAYRRTRRRESPTRTSGPTPPGYAKRSRSSVPRSPNTSTGSTKAPSRRRPLLTGRRSGDSARG